MRRLIHLLAAAPLGGSVAGKMLLNRGTKPHKHPELAAMPAPEKRDTIPWGGYYLLVRDQSRCPSDTDKCGQAGCCPKGTFCVADPDANDYPVCCPEEGRDCSGVIQSVYACADTRWTLWEYFSDRFCCLGDEVGTHEPGKDEQCLPTSIPVPSSIIVKSLPQQTRNIPKPTNTNTSPGGSQTTGTSANPTQGSDEGNPNSPQTGGNTNNPGDGGLSTPATIAIAVLATALGLAIIFMVFFAWYRSQKKKQLAKATAPVQVTTGEATPGPGLGTFDLPPGGMQAIAQPPRPYVPSVVPGSAPYQVLSATSGSTIPQQQQHQQPLNQTEVIQVHSTPSPGPSLDPPPQTGPAPPAYVPVPAPHPNTQELHSQEITPGSAYQVVSPASGGPGDQHQHLEELDGRDRPRSPHMHAVEIHGHPGIDTAALEDCSPSPGETTTGLLGHGRG